MITIKSLLPNKDMQISWLHIIIQITEVPPENTTATVCRKKETE